MGGLSVLVIIVILLLCVRVLQTNNKGQERYTRFECGFEAITNTRRPFSTRYYLLVIVFLIFDVELCLLLPYVSAYFNMRQSSPLIWVSIIVILLAGIFHELNENSIT